MQRLTNFPTSHRSQIARHRMPSEKRAECMPPRAPLSAQACFRLFPPTGESRMKQQIALLALAAVLFPLSGCNRDTGPTRVSVTGEVLLDGEPLPEGMIRFIPDPSVSGSAVAAKIERGKFSLRRREGPVEGKYRVEIEATGHQDFPIDDEEAFAAAFARQPRKPLGENPVPMAYNERSQLTEEIIAPGPLELRFELSSQVSRTSGTSRHER
jgi:hypothetical protein